MSIFKFFAKKGESVKIADIREYLFQELIGNSKGFEKVSGQDRIARKTIYGKDVFHVVIHHNRNGGYRIEANAHRRFDELEVIYAEFKTDPKSQKHTTTIGGNLSDLLNKRIPKGCQVSPNYEYEITTRFGLEKATKKMLVLLKKTEMAFFEKYNTFLELYDIVNVDLRESGKHVILYSNKALLGLTLSRLLKDKDYEMIKKIYLEQVNKYIPGDLPSFLGLIEKLETNY
jgi:hypothetical protein